MKRLGSYTRGDIYASMLIVLAFVGLSCSDFVFDNPVDTNVQLDAPAITSVIAQADTAVLVAWTYSGKTVSGFQLERQVGTGSWTGVGTTNSAARVLIDRVALVVGQTYKYHVRALSSNNQSAYVSSTPLSIVFTDPTNVILTAQADTAVVVAWSYTGALQTGFEVERQVGTGSWTGVGTTNSAARQLIDRVALLAGQTYKYQVRALSSNNQSAYATSTPLSIVFTDPTNVTLTAQADTAVVVAWLYSGNIQTGFEVERQVGTGSWTAVGTTNASTRLYRDDLTLSDGETYTYHIRAVGRNYQSQFVSCTPFSASLAAPTNVAATALTTSSVSLSWQDNSTIERAFGIEESADGLSFSQIGTVPAGSTIATVATTHVVGQYYWFRVRALGRFANGAYSVAAQSKVAPPGMILVTGGTFQMGSTTGNSDEIPVHAVTVSSFYLDAKEVTVVQYRAFCTATSRSMPSPPSWGWSDNNPIVNVSWIDATAYATWAVKRLPTEAEWEYAARGGTLTHGYTYSGSNTIGDVAWYTSNSGSRTQAVGTKTPNELGLYDMSGNAWEWCSDWYDGGYYSVSPSVNPKGPSTGTYRVLRGGSWGSFEDSCRVANRLRNTPTNIFDYIVFRCAADL
jgi:formylglycine-generating enzyme required for sulfatase activity